MDLAIGDEVKSAWCQYLADAGPEAHTKLDLEGLLDLLAWYADRVIERERPHLGHNNPLRVKMLYKGSRGWELVVQVGYGGTMGRYLNRVQLGAFEQQSRKASLLEALESLIEKYPEVLE